MNKSNEHIRPQQLINTENNFIVISNHAHTKSFKNKPKIIQKTYNKVENLLNNFRENKKKNSKITTLVNAPYLKLPGSNSFAENIFNYSSSRRAMKSDKKRKSGLFQNSYIK